MSKVVHFEIVAIDVERASKFYTTVFGWEIKKVEGMEPAYWLIMASPANTPGAINGGMRKEMGTDVKEMTKSVNGFICVIDVPSIDATLAMIEPNGGKVMQPKMAVPGVGFLAYCYDTEGNVICVMEAEAK